MHAEHGGLDRCRILRQTVTPAAHARAKIAHIAIPDVRPPAVLGVAPPERGTSSRSGDGRHASGPLQDWRCLTEESAECNDYGSLVTFPRRIGDRPTA